jgi:hypothetical protein
VALALRDKTAVAMPIGRWNFVQYSSHHFVTPRNSPENGVLSGAGS